MTCLPAGGSAWAREGWAKYLQHCLPWTDQAGERGLCRERTAACQTQVSGTHIRGKATSIKAVHQNMNETWVCSGVLLIIQVKCKNWNLGPVMTSAGSVSQQPCVCSDSATSRCWIESRGAWRLCTPRWWPSGLWIVGSQRRSTTSSYPFISLACTYDQTGSGSRVILPRAAPEQIIYVGRLMLMCWLQMCGYENVRVFIATCVSALSS